MNVRVSLAVLALATLLKVVYTVQGVSESFQRSTFVGLAMFVLMLPSPRNKKRGRST